MKQLTLSIMLAVFVTLASCNKDELGTEAQITVRGKGKFYQLQYVDQDNKTQIMIVDSGSTRSIRVSNNWIISATQQIDTGWVVLEGTVKGNYYSDSTNGLKQIRATIFKK